jgi:hypothetical protein
MAEAAAESGQWLTQTEAAARLSWHIERVKAAARRGRLERRKNNQGQWLVLVTAELLPRAAYGSGNGNAPGTYGDSHADAQGAAHGIGEPAQGDAHAMALAMAELREELTEARVAAAHAEGKATVLVAALEYERAERSRLAAELAEARKGWLERLIEAVRRR